jgi:predicted RNA-binding protein with RPS1 domain
VGEEVIGVVSKITDFGLFIRLADGVEGLAHVSEVNRDPRQKLDKNFHVGEAMRARIIKIDANERKIGLTTRDVEPLTEEERAQYAGSAEHEPVHDHDHDDHGGQHAEPVHEAPAHEAPAHEATAHEATAHEATAHEDTAHEDTARETTAHETPAHETTEPSETNPKES